MAKSRFHGVFSLALIAGAFVFGGYIILRSTPSAAFLYGTILFLGSLTIIYAFCTKCPIRTSGCRHVLPGPLTLWLPARTQTAYTVFDYFIVLVILLVLIAYPQPWLYPHKGAMIIFWVLLLAGLAEITLYVCKGCGNTRCLVCKLRNRSV